MNLKPHLNTTITIADVIGDNVYGNPEFENRREIQVRWKDKTNRVVNANGDEVTSGSFFLTFEPVDYSTAIWGKDVDSTDDNAVVFPTAIESGTPLSDESTIHYKVYL